MSSGRLSDQDRKFERMTTLPVRRLVAGLAVPSILSMLITAFYNIVDTFFVGQLGSSATGAIGVMYSLMAIIQAVGFGFGAGSGVYISRKLGERDVAEACRMATVAVVSVFGVGVLIGAVGLFFFEPLPFWLGSTATIAPFARDYMLFVLLGAPFFACSLTLNNQLRLQGNAHLAVVGIGAGAVLNCLLDPVFIFGCGWGVKGAGLSTLLSQVVSFSLLLVITQRSDAVSLSRRDFCPSRARYLSILQGGTPAVGRQGMQCFVSILLNHVMRAFGDRLFAAMTIVLRLTNFLFAITAGIGQGFQPVCGFNFGARRYGRVLAAYFYTQRVAVGLLVVLTVVLACFAPAIVSAFSDEAEVVALGATAARLQCIGIPFMGFCIIAGMLFQNTGRYVSATLVSVSRSGLFFIPVILITPRVWGEWGVMCAQPLADLLSFGMTFALNLWALRLLRRGSRQEG